MNSDTLRIGLIAGTFLALFHATWALIVAIGWAQPLLDFIFWAHFITPVYHIEPFALPRAVALVGLTFLVGLVCGAAAMMIWNCFTQFRHPLLRRLLKTVQ